MTKQHPHRRTPCLFARAVVPWMLGLLSAAFVIPAEAAPQSVKLVWDMPAKVPGATLIPVPPEKALSAEQVQQIEQDLTAGLHFYRLIGMPEPPMPTLGDQYVAFMSMVMPTYDQAAAFTGKLYGFDRPQHPFVLAPRGETVALVLLYENYFEDGDITSGRHPRKGRITANHELFHAFAWTIPRGNWDNDDNTHLWVSEGTTDAIAPFSFRAGRGAWNFYRALQSGDQSMGKTLGLRPYDYPLDLATMPTQRSWLFTRFPALRQANNRETTRTHFSYMTSSFWRFLMKEALLGGDTGGGARAWRQMNLIFSEPLRADESASRQRFTAWLDRWIRTHHPVWKTQGLYGAYPAFVAHWVEFPDQFMSSRRGMFKHPKWLDAVFHDGCKTLELDEQRPTATFDLKIRPVAATCLVLQWKGETLPESGWPTINVVAHALETGDVTGRIAGLRALHLGVRGHTVGHGPIYVDRGRGTAVKSWGGVAVDPLNPKKTDGAAVLTFSNVAPMAAVTEARTYRIHIGAAFTSATGSLTRPAQPEVQQPASTAQPKKTQRRAMPSLPIKQAAHDEASIMVSDLGTVDALDCANASLKLASGAFGGFGRGRVQEGPDAGQITERACAKFVVQMSDGTGLRALADGGLEVELVLPAIRSGQTGSVPGASVKAYWADPALNVGPFGNAEVRAETDVVNLVIAESNEAFISGGFSARFDERRHEVKGTVSGEFLLWRADTDELMLPDDPLHMMSSDFLMVMAGQGLDVDEIRRRARQSETNTDDPPPATARRGEGCRCDCAEFGAFTTPIPASRSRCAMSCGNYPMAHQCVVEHEVRSGRSATAVHAAIDACATSCSAFREGAVPALCREALWSLYAGCSESGPVTDAELLEWVDWMVRELPEPQKSQLRSSTLAQLREADAETRERWVQTMRQARRDQESE